MANKATKTKDTNFEQDLAEAIDHVIQSHSYIPVGETKEIINKTATRMLSELGYDSWLKIQANKKIIADTSDRLGYEAYKAKQNGTPNDDDPQIENLQRYMKQAESRMALAKIVFEALTPSFIAVHGRVPELQDWVTVQEQRKEYRRRTA